MVGVSWRLRTWRPAEFLGLTVFRVLPSVANPVTERGYPALIALSLACPASQWLRMDADPASVTTSAIIDDGALDRLCFPYYLLDQTRPPRFKMSG